MSRPFAAAGALPPLIARRYAVENVVFAWPLAQAGLQESLERGVHSFLFVAKALIKHKLEGQAQLLYLYSQDRDGDQPQRTTSARGSPQ